MLFTHHFSPTDEWTLLWNFIRIYHECEGRIEKSVPRITNWHHRVAEWWQTVIARDRFFYPILTRIIYSFSCSPLNTSFNIVKTEKRRPENPEYAEMWYRDVAVALKWRHGSTCGRRAAVRFLSFPTQAGTRMWDRIISHGWKQRKSGSGVRERVYHRHPCWLFLSHGILHKS